MPHEICPSCDQPIDDNTPHPFCARPCGCGIAIPHSTSAHTRPTQPSVDSDAQLPIPDLQPTDALPTDQLSALGVPPVDLDGQQNYNTARVSVAKPRSTEPLQLGLRGTQAPHGIDVFSVSIVDNPDPPDCRIQTSQSPHDRTIQPPQPPDKQRPTEPSSSYPALPFGQTQHSPKRGILIVDDPPSGPPEPLTGEQRQKVEDWYKQAPIPGLPTLDDVERQMSPMRSTDLLVIKNDPKPGMEERIKQLTAQIKADYAPRPIMFDADDGAAPIMHRTVVKPEELVDDARIVSSQSCFTPDPVEQCVGTYVDIYRMAHPCTGVHGCRAHGCPVLRKPEQTDPAKRFLAGGMNPDKCQNCGMASKEHAVGDGACPTSGVERMSNEIDAGILGEVMAAVGMDAKEASARAVDEMVAAAPSCRNCGSKRVEPDGGRKLCLNCGFRQ